MGNINSIKLFGLNNLAIEAELRRIQLEHKTEIGHSDTLQDRSEEKFFSQFSKKLQDEASSMARHFTIFYCLENSIRELISERLEEIHGISWWEVSVPPNVKENALKNRKKEVQSGFTLRSDKIIDYSNFVELGEIIKFNWTVFGETFRDIDAVQRILSNLNTLRAPIAHCKPLAEDEILRLHLGLRDWFRQMS